MFRKKLFYDLRHMERPSFKFLVITQRILWEQTFKWLTPVKNNSDSTTLIWHVTADLQDHRESCTQSWPTVVHDCGISLCGKFSWVFIPTVGPFTKNNPRLPGLIKASVGVPVSAFLSPTQLPSKTGTFFEAQRSQPQRKVVFNFQNCGYVLCIFIS